MEVQAALESNKFEVRALTAAVNNLDIPKTRIAELGLFQEKGIRTTTVEIEFKDGQIQIVEEAERGEDGKPLDDPERKIVTFKAIHLPVPGKIMADDVLNMRAFGSESEIEELQTLIDEKSELARMSIDATIEYFRIGAIFGKVIGKNGNTLVDLFKVFDLKVADGESSVDFNKPLRSQLVQVVRDSESHQKGIKAKRYRAFCTPDFIDELMEDEGFVKAFERANNGQVLRDDIRPGVFWQGVYWEEYDTKVGKKDFLKDRNYGAVVFPEDKPNFLLTRFAPANYNETVGTVGLPYYGAAEPLSLNKGIKMENQSNPINVCTSPLAVRRIKFTAKA